MFMNKLPVKSITTLNALFYLKDPMLGLVQGTVCNAQH